MAGYPKTGWGDLLRLVGLLVGAWVAGADRSEALVRWLAGVTRRRGPNVLIHLIVRRVLFVSGSALSAHILESAPSRDGFAAGTVKRKAMSFLAPHALTILQDREWRTYRIYNETVLQTGCPHMLLPFVLAKVEKAFAVLPSDIDEIRSRMGSVMLELIFGEDKAPAQLIDDVQELFAEVRLRTAFIGSRKGALRDRFYRELRGQWERSTAVDEPSLLALAHKAMAGIGSDAFQNDALLEQIPHWMFTFTNSGSDLLARSLAMIIARPETLARVREEIDAAGVPEDPRTIHRLDYLQACIFETGRLFPPVMQTAHRAEQRDVFAGYEIPAGTEILQFFPFNNRTTSRDGAGDFRPERWMSADAAERMRSSTLFLSGARACPGRDLILFVLKGAISIILHSECVRPTQNVLSRDPLPVMFPSQALRFLTRDIHVQ